MLLFHLTEGNVLKYSKNLSVNFISEHKEARMLNEGSGA